LIQLPEKRFPAYEQTVRVVDQDSTLSVEGTRYTVPPTLACRSVAVRLFAEHFEVLDSHQRIAFSRRYVPQAEKGKLIIDPTHYATLKRRSPSQGQKRLDEAFITRFPTLAPFIRGLQNRMKALAPVHIRALLRLAEAYGEKAFVEAVSRAQHYRRFDAHAVERILEAQYPLLDENPLAPLGGLGADIVGEVDSGSLDDYAELDHETQSDDNDNNDDSEDNHGS
jgi:hypothetical protein